MKYSRAAGYSLVGLMVGLAISMIVVVTMLSVYKVTLQVTVTAGQDARADGQTASAMLAAEVGLQSAGSGIPNATYGCPEGQGTTTAICLLNEAEYSNGKVTGTVVNSNGGTGNAVIWSWKIDASSYACGMLIYDTSYNSGMGGLLYASRPGSCGTDTVWQSPTILVLDRTGPEDGDRSFEIIIEKTSCRNFGVFGQGVYLLSIAGRKSEALTSIGSVCLVDIQ